jgi:hypothetical protein
MTPLPATSPRPSITGSRNTLSTDGPRRRSTAKKEKYQKSFTLYVDGDEVYAKAKADALESDLEPLVGGGLVTRLAKHDTNPANNPQPPARYRK